MAKIGLVGAGAWGTALALQATGAGHEVTMWTFEAELATTINEKHINNLYLDGERLPRGLKASSSLEETVAGAEFRRSSIWLF